MFAKITFFPPESLCVGDDVYYMVHVCVVQVMMCTTHVCCAGDDVYYMVHVCVVQVMMYTCV